MSYVRPLVLLTVTLSAQLLVPACGSDSGNGGGSGGSRGSGGAPSSDSGTPGPKLSELPTELATTLCAVTSKCLGPVADVYLAGQSCTDKQVAELNEGSFSLLQGAIDGKRVTYDAGKVAGCLEAVKKEGCGVFANRLGTVCDGVFTGTVASGGDCTLNEECKKDLFCETGSSCPGKCTALLSAGGACKTNDACKDGLICADASKTCVTAAAAGDPCKGNSGKECPANLVCVGATDTAAGTCKPIDTVFAGTDGAACDPTTTVFCAANLRCAVSSVDPGGNLVWKCEKPATSQACHVAFPEACPDGQFCFLGTTGSIEGACKPLPGDGEACSGSSAADTKKDKCAPTALCVGGTCKAIQHLGGACASDAQCVGKLCKDGKCVAAECDAPAAP
jgi:hypothetical protein